MVSDEIHIRRALELARAGVGLASPNPAVGAVVIDGAGNEIGAGTHTYNGVKHAEVLALEQAGERARGGTLYVNLEPCSHHGRTGPCADAIIAAGISRVVCAMEDPNPRVAGKGFQKLTAAGIAVEVGAFATEARKLNESFAKYIRHGIPFVTLKTALSLDGKIARSPTAHAGAAKTANIENTQQASSTARQNRDSYHGMPSGMPEAPPHQRAFRRGNEDLNSYDTPSVHAWITGEAARADVQRHRHEHDAILVGVGTVIADDPLLTDRTGLPRRRRLLRVVLDSHLRIPLTSRIIESAQDDVLIVYSSTEDEKRRALEAMGIRLEQIPEDPAGRVNFIELLRRLGQLEISSLLVEGGARVNGSVLASGQVDKVFLYFAPKIFGEGVPFACGEGWEAISFPRELKLMEFHRFGEDFAVEGYLRDPYEVNF